jgi:hypothetical protein
MKTDKEEIKKIINKIFGEQNLYKINLWNHPNKKCRHNNSIFCMNCKKDIEDEKTI